MNKRGFILIDCLLSMTFVAILIVCLFNQVKTNISMHEYIKDNNEEVRRLYE